MKFRRRPRNDIAIELVPLVDVVLVLLLFFMVSTTFIRQSELKVELPEASATSQQTDTSIVMAIGADGEYAVNGRLLVDNKLPTLMRALSEAAGGDTAKHLVINADADARHQSVVRAMDAAGQLGLIHLSITTRSPDDTR